MTFPLDPASPFIGFVSVFPSATANAWRTYISRSLDTLDGGEYGNVEEISWAVGSAGWKFKSLVTIDSTGSFIVAAGATFTVNADADFYAAVNCQADSTLHLFGGSAAQFDNGSNVTCNGTWAFGEDSLTFVNGSAGHLAAVAFGAFSAIGHGTDSSDVYGTGSILTINTALASLGSGAVLTVNGSITVVSGGALTAMSGSLVNLTVGGGGNAGTFTLAADGTATQANGSHHNIAAGAFCSWSIGGGGATSTVTYGASSTVTHQGSSTEVYSANSIKTDGSTTTRSGSVTKSGPGAWTEDRLVTAPDMDANIDGLATDEFLIPTTVTGTHVYTLQAPAGNKKVCLDIVNHAAFDQVINNQSGIEVFTFAALAAGSSQGIKVRYSGSTWRLAVAGEVYPTP